MMNDSHIISDFFDDNTESADFPLRNDFFSSLRDASAHARSTDSAFFHIVGTSTRHHFGVGFFRPTNARARHIGPDTLVRGDERGDHRVAER